MPEPLATALRRTRAVLNSAIALHRACAWAAPAAIGSGLLVVAARALGLGGAGFALWAGLSLTAAALGAFVSRSSFVDERGAARWLDSRLDDDELLSAALACLRRGAEGRFDAEIIEKAGGLLPRLAPMKPPRAPLAKRGGIAVAALAIGAYAIFLSGTAMGSLDPASAKARGDADRVSAAKKPTAASALEEGGKAASQFAAALFPDDKRMATLTERALREGRIDDLRGLLKAAGLGLEAKLAGPLSESERKKLTSDRGRLGEADAALALAAQAAISRADGGGGKGLGPRGEGDGGSGSSRFGDPNARGGRGGGSGRAPGGRGNAPNADSGVGGDSGGGGGDRGSAGEGGSEGAGMGGKSYGTGSGAEGDWGAIKPAAASGKMAIEETKNPSYFELVLPGSEASAPISSLAPLSRKSAEAAMSREGLPLEYEDFVRSYFLALSQGPKP